MRLGRWRPSVAPAVVRSPHRPGEGPLKISRIRSIVIALVVLMGVVATVYGIVGFSPAAIQPLAFNHAVHIDSASLECVDCHKDAMTGRFAGLPGKQICLDCHDADGEAGSHAQKDKLFSFGETDREIPWVRVAITKPDVFFSHRRHAAVAKIECMDCHVGQAKLTAPPRSVRRVMAMTECIACHERNGTSSDCLVCHR